MSIGKGQFGVVYFGYLEDGTPVAVKTRLESSSHGVNEFLAEVSFLPAHLLSSYSYACFIFLFRLDQINFPK